MSRRLRIFFIIVLVLIPVFRAVLWAFVPVVGSDTTGSLVELAGVDPTVIKPDAIVVTAMTRVLGFLASMPSWGMYVVALWYVQRLLKLYGQGSLFEAEDVRCIGRIGWALLLAPVLKPVCIALGAAVLQMNSPGKSLFVLKVAPQDLTTVGIAMGIIVVARVMDEARKLKEDAALTI